MQWPVMSPDVNPMENIWADVSRGLNNLDEAPTNMAELTRAVLTCWRDIPEQTFTSLVASMPRRVRVLYNARGGLTSTKCILCIGSVMLVHITKYCKSISTQTRVTAFDKIHVFD